MPRAQTAPEGKKVARSAQYNVWRVLSGPPQDVPLALCAFPHHPAIGDLLDCDAIFDPPGGAPEWGFENYVIQHNPAHRWYYYSDMTPSEAIVFKTSESDPPRAQLMPHGAFDNPLAGRRRAAAGQPRKCAGSPTGSNRRGASQKTRRVAEPSSLPRVWSPLAGLGDRRCSNGP